MIHKNIKVVAIILFVSGCGGGDSGSSYPEDTTTQVATITVDGDPADWVSLTPSNTQPSGDTICGSDTDITNIYTAMDATNVYVMVETSGTPINFDATMEINFNYKSGHHAAPYDDYADIQTNITHSVLSAWTNENLDDVIEPYAITSYVAARGTVFEMSIALSEIGNPSFFNSTFVNIWDNAYVLGSTGCDPTDVY